MRLIHMLRTGAAALALAAAAAGAPVYAQGGSAPGDALATPAPMALFPPALPPAAAQGAGSGQSGGVGGIADRVRTQEVNFPERQDKTLINLGTPYLNAIFGGLGLGSGTGLGIQVTTADAIEPVELFAEAIISFRKYRQFEVGAIIGNETDRVELRARYRRRPKDNFFGLGPFAEKEGLVDPVTGVRVLGGETNFDLEQRSFIAGYAHNFLEKSEVGVYVDYTSSSVYEGEDDEDPSIFALYRPLQRGLECSGTIPPAILPAVFTTQLPGLGTGSKIFSYGAYAELDFRNDEDGLRKGAYLYVRYASYDGTDEVVPFLGNGFGDAYDYGWNRFSLDGRVYIPIFSDKTSLALRIATDLRDRKGGSTIPFYELSRLGGSGLLRGFDTFRFYGEDALLFQGEFRQTVYTRNENQGADIVVFGDLGQVSGLGFEATCPTPGIILDRGDDFDSDNFEADFGFAGQYRFAKGAGFRVEYAHSNEDDKVRLVFSAGF